MFSAELFSPFGSLCTGAIIDRNVIAAFGFQMAGHRIAHYAEAEEGHFYCCHSLSLQREIGGSGEWRHDRLAIGGTLRETVIPVFKMRG